MHMRRLCGAQVYDQFCIPVFGDPTNPMGAANNYSCDFLNVGATNTSFVLLHDDRYRGMHRVMGVGVTKCARVSSPR